MVDQRQVMGFRIRAQQLDRATGTLPGTAVLDVGARFRPRKSTRSFSVDFES